MTSSALRYFAEPGVTTDLSRYSEIIADLPADPAELGRILRGLIIHEGLAAQCGWSFRLSAAWSASGCSRQLRSCRASVNDARVAVDNRYY